jgi:Arc/MetJ-type ribon-helix-helix transcriptional regulator
VNTIKIITLHLPEPYLKALDTLIAQNYYPNRAELIRIAIRDLLNVEFWKRTEIREHV